MKLYKKRARPDFKQETIKIIVLMKNTHVGQIIWSSNFILISYNQGYHLYIIIITFIIDIKLWVLRHSSVRMYQCNVCHKCVNILPLFKLPQYCWWASSWLTEYIKDTAVKRLNGNELAGAAKTDGQEKLVTQPTNKF